MKKCNNKWNLKWINLKIIIYVMMKGMTMNIGMKLNAALMEMKAQINV